MNSVVKVSVIVPVYNVQDYIEQCARSLFNQTLSEVEFIFVDDASTDHSIDILNEVIRDYPDVKSKTKIIHHPVNKGLPEARMSGIKIATGTYIAHCDSDDWVEPNMYQTLYDEAICKNADIVWCNCYYEDLNKTGKPRIGSDFCSFLYFGINVWNKLYIRSLYDDILYVPHDNFMEDMVFNIQLFYSASRIIHLNEPLYHYRINPLSICGLKSEKDCLRKVEMAQNNIRLIERFFAEKNIQKLYKTDLIYYKFIVKNQITPLLSIPEYRKMWRSLYKEINISFFFSKINFVLKLIFFLRLLGVSYQKNGR